MKIVLQRVKRAKVTIDNKVNGEIKKGYLLLLGIGKNDNEETAVQMIEKVKNLPSGSCVLFGTAFKFPVLTMIDMPDPVPLSQSCDIDKVWYTN